MPQLGKPSYWIKVFSICFVACFDISLSDSSTDVQEYGWVPTPDGAFHESLEKQELFLSNANLKIG
jgi:hypothetical protein